MIPGNTSPKHAAHVATIREASRLANEVLNPPQIQQARIIRHARREAGRTPRYKMVGTQKKTCTHTLAVKRDKPVLQPPTSVQAN
jgi:hypothetical protein